MYSSACNTLFLISALALFDVGAWPILLRSGCSLNQTVLNEIMGKQREFSSFSLEPALGLTAPEAGPKGVEEAVAQLALSDLKNTTDVDVAEVKACLMEYLRHRPMASSHKEQPSYHLPGPQPPSTLHYATPFHLGGLIDNPAPELSSNYFPDPYDTYVNPHNFLDKVPSYRPTSTITWDDEVDSLLTSTYNATISAIYGIFNPPDLSDLFD